MATSSRPVADTHKQQAELVVNAAAVERVPSRDPIAVDDGQDKEVNADSRHDDALLSAQTEQNLIEDLLAENERLSVTQTPQPAAGKFAAYLHQFVFMLNSNKDTKQDHEYVICRGQQQKLHHLRGRAT